METRLAGVPELEPYSWNDGKKYGGPAAPVDVHRQADAR